MPPAVKIVRFVVTAVFSLLAGVLVLQALAYGVGFALNPESGVGEFGYQTPTVVEPLTVMLVGLVGVGMLANAALLVVSVVLVWRANPAGAYVAMIVGGAYVLYGAVAYRAEWWWDANFYGFTGAALFVLAVAVRLLRPRNRGDDGA